MPAQTVRGLVGAIVTSAFAFGDVMARRTAPAADADWVTYFNRIDPYATVLGNPVHIALTVLSGLNAQFAREQGKHSAAWLYSVVAVSTGAAFAVTLSNNEPLNWRLRTLRLRGSRFIVRPALDRPAGETVHEWRLRWTRASVVRAALMGIASAASIAALGGTLSFHPVQQQRAGVGL
jgi:Anthrone oxygenase